ncbi:MAG: DUF1330 domain-containing protein [Xanthobacteraceae bacterium]
MAAYVIYARRDETDGEKSRQYSKLAVPQIREFGGEIVTARGKVHVLEGDWQPKAITILKFESKQALMNWYQSSEYAPLKRMRLESNVGDFVVVEEI